MDTQLEVVINDLIEFAKTLSGFILIASLAVVWLALGFMIAYCVMQDPAQGTAAFKFIMGFEGTGIRESVRFPIMIVNYLTLIGLSVWFIIGPVRDYLNSIDSRARAMNFKPSNGDDDTGGFRNVANG